MAEARKLRRVGPLPWQAKLRMARNDRQWDAVAAQQDAITAQIDRSVTFRFLEDTEDRVVANPSTPAAPSNAGAERAARVGLCPCCEERMRGIERRIRVAGAPMYFRDAGK